MSKNRSDWISECPKPVEPSRSVDGSGSDDLAACMRLHGLEPTVADLEQALDTLIRLESACEVAARAFLRAGIDPS